MIHVELRWDGFGCAASSPEQDQYFNGAAIFARGEGLSKLLTDCCRHQRYESIAELKAVLIDRARTLVAATLDGNNEVVWMAYDPLDRDTAADIERRNAPPPPPAPPKPRLPMVRSALVDARLRCDACEHWDVPGKRGTTGIPSEAHAVCNRAAYGDDDNESEGSVVCDAEYYAAELWTLPDFGCVLFEEKKDV